MNASEINTHTTFVLPLSVISKIDVSHLVSELERIDNDLTAAAVRTKAGTPSSIQPTVSAQFSDFATQNQLTLTTAQERTALISELRLLKETVPTIHMTFAVPADNESLQKLVQWLRASVHPQAVIAVGLQPGLVAGVYLRTPNQVHDLSLRAMLENGHGLLVKALETLHASI